MLIGNDDTDISIYELQAYDSCGNPCPTAADTAILSVSSGMIVGVGNGDPACLDYEQKPMEEEWLSVRTFACEDGLYSVPPKAQNRPYRRCKPRYGRFFFYGISAKA